MTAVPTTLTEPDASATGTGGFERQLFFDGLHLRAEHLRRMQDFTAMLARATAAAAGPGAHAGLGLSVKDDVLHVESGIAVDGGGRLLRSADRISVPLKDLDRKADRYWVVQATSANFTTGVETVAGGVCDDDCGSRTSRPAVGVDGVSIQLIRAERRDLSQQPDPRSVLAHDLFGAEEFAAGRLGEASFADRSWDVPSWTSDASGAVPLGVLLQGVVAGKAIGWEVDEWAVRRELSEPPGQRGWRWRLGLRPWDVFVAQILQFQALFADRIPSFAIGAGDDADTFVSMGIKYLPPAGFLPADVVSDLAESIAVRLFHGFAADLDIRVCHGRPDEAVEAVCQSQHRPRFGALKTPQPVDIIVPERSGVDPRRDWVAFACRSERICSDNRVRRVAVKAAGTTAASQAAAATPAKAAPAKAAPAKAARVAAVKAAEPVAKRAPRKAVAKATPATKTTARTTRRRAGGPGAR